MSETEYRQELRAPVRGLWAGAIDEFQAHDAVDVAIRRQLPKAWAAGAKQCGVLPNEMTPQEKARLRQIIQSERGYIDGLLDAVEVGSRANGGKLTPLFRRVNVWLGRYRQVVSTAQVMTCKDKKLKWIITAAESCISCRKLAGKVKRASFWETADLRPQSPRLECVKSAGGIPVCKCYFEVTDEPLTPGRLPRI